MVIYVNAAYDFLTVLLNSVNSIQLYLAKGLAPLEDAKKNNSKRNIIKINNKTVIIIVTICKKQPIEFSRKEFILRKQSTKKYESLHKVFLISNNAQKLMPPPFC